MLLVAVAGSCADRLHGIFGFHNSTSTAGLFSNKSAPFNPKHVVLGVFGPPGTVATEPAVFANVVAQGDSDSIGCRRIVGGVVKNERSVNTDTFCLDKSG